MGKNFWFGFGAAAFAAGFVAILALRRSAPEGAPAAKRKIAMRLKTREEENDKLIHSLVVLTAGTAYLLMFSGGGRKAALGDGHELFYARYIDWAITTPLLLTGLALTALGTPFRRWGLLLSLLFVDVYMILTGYLADEAARGSVMKWIWYGISSGAFLGLYYMLWGPLRDEAAKTGEGAADLYGRNLTFLSIVWAGYPLNFLLGPEGVRAIDTDTSTAFYTGLDITAKILFGLYSLSNTQAKAAGELERGEVPEHELRPAEAIHREVWERGAPEGDGARRTR